MFVGILCSLVSMAEDVTFGLTQKIVAPAEGETQGKLEAVSYTGTDHVTNSGYKLGSEVNTYLATGSTKTVSINGVTYATASQWRKTVKGTAYSDNQWAGYELTVAKGYMLNITGVHAMLAVADDTYTWKVSILDASDKVLYESQNKTTKTSNTTDFVLNFSSLSDEVKAKLTGVTGTIKVRVYMYQNGGTKYFAIPYLTVTGNVEVSNTPSYTVTASANSETAGTVSGDGDWEEGKDVTLTATPKTGYKFTKWVIDDETEVTDNPYVISNIAANHTAVAYFEALPKITYALGEGQGIVPAVDYGEVGSKITLPKAQAQLIYKEGHTLLGWMNGENFYGVGQEVTVTGDMTFTAVFGSNEAALGDEETTVDWTFKTSEGAPTVAVEGKVGYYAKNVIISGKPVDVIMKVNATDGAAFEGARGKWNNATDANRAQVNKGTIFTIPAIKGMTVTVTITNGTAAADMFTFNGEAGTANTSAKTVSYTYQGDAETIDIIDQGKNAYPAGISVVYPVKAITKLNSFGLATFSAAQDVQITGAKVYTAVVNSDGTKLVCTEVADGLVPAGNGVVLVGEADAEFVATPVASAPALAAGNVLQATTLADGSLKEWPAGTIEFTFVLFGDTFKRLVPNTAFTPNKAYVLATDIFSGSAKGLSIVFDDATAINNVAGSKAEVAVKKFFKNGQLLIQTAKGTVNAVGVQVK